MQTEIDVLMNEVNKLQRVKNEKFYDEHVTNEYKWDDYVDYKDKSNTKVGKLITQKEKNLKDQKQSVKLVGYRMRDSEMNVAKANANQVPDHVVVNVSKRLSVKNPLAAMEMILEQQNRREGNPAIKDS